MAKYEIMDGAPVRGESIPIRLFLQYYNLSPTYKSIQNLFSVRYYLNLVLVDEEDRRYFKQQEITLWRKAELGENRIPTSQFISNQLPNGHFKGSGDACESDQKNLQSAPPSTGDTVEP